MNHDVFLAAVEADPELESPKLIYADWCEEQGGDLLASALRWCARRGKWPKRVLAHPRRESVVEPVSLPLPRRPYERRDERVTDRDFSRGLSAEYNSTAMVNPPLPVAAVVAEAWVWEYYGDQDTEEAFMCVVGYPIHMCLRQNPSRYPTRIKALEDLGYALYRLRELVA